MRRVAIVAGEPSGDLLGAGLMRALTLRYPDVRFEGIGGPAMIAEGLEGFFALETLSVMGLVEVLRHLPRLLEVRRSLLRRFSEQPPDVFIGIDAPDFNLGLERRLRERCVPTVHYVSPSVWAWRQRRVHSIARAVDHMLVLLPFEAAFYKRHGVPVTFVGHPAADRFALVPDVARHRYALGLAETQPVVAVLPGSRDGEVARLGPPFAQALAWLKTRYPELQIVAPMATPALGVHFSAMLAEAGLADQVMLLDGDSAIAMGAADAVLTASGTATLEGMLLKRPMVVAYRVAPLTAWLVRRLRLLKTSYFALPNLLAGEVVVPEFIQGAVTAEALAGAVATILENPGQAAVMRERFDTLHRLLRRGADERAADAVERTLG